MSTLESPTLNRSSKDDIRALIDRLSDDCTFDEVQYALFVLENIRKGKGQIDCGEGIPQHQVEQQISLMLMN